jgi:alginate O-acetyltransferase complex protein AlgI
MEFNSFIFFLFFVAVAIIYYLFPARLRNLVLLIFNYLFYCYFDYRFAVLLLSLTSLTFLVGNKIFDSTNYDKKRRLVTVGVIINVIVLGFFKYFNFFSDSFTSLFGMLGLSSNELTLKIILPLGISFYVFQTLTYIFDVYFENINEKYGFINFAIFASFFPTVVAGPIERASRLLPQIKSERKFDSNNLKLGFSLIVIGLFRKVLIGDAAGRIVNNIFAEPKYYTSFEILVSIILYSIQIYNDFAGYSNIARGVAKILGFDIYINFKQPYFSVSVADFWRRWHISLSLWLKDYLFTPLQIKFRYYKQWGNVIAIMITFTLCGLWHGASWTFVFWGFLHGFYMAFALIAKKQKNSISGIFKSKKLVHAFQVIITYCLIAFAWIFFRADNFNTAFIIITRLFEFTAGEFTLRFLKIMAGFTVVSFVMDYLESKWDSDAILFKIKPVIRYAVSLAVLIIVFAYLLTADKSPFIYAQF